MVANKRKRSDDDSKKKESPLTREDSTKAPSKSILTSSDTVFPRGGASALTPLELKEVANEATRDVLFEREIATKATTSEESRPKKKKKTTKSKSKSTLAEEEEEKVPIESLTFKSLLPGTLVLGQIQEINRLDIVLALADNIVGYIPITSISPSITEQLEQFDDDSDEESDDDDDEDEQPNNATAPKEFPVLSKFFKLGQWLRAIVTESTVTKTKNQKKRIELSIEVEKTNKNLDEDDLVTNSTIQVAVKSIEDHGIILDVGKEGLTAFISNKELKAASYEPEDLQIGSVLLSTIVNKKGRTITVKLVSNKKNSVTTISSIDSIVPGNLIDVLVTGIEDEGVVTKAFGLVDATINFSHLGLYNETDIKHKYAVGSTIKARVLAVLLVAGSKKLYLSVLPHTLSLNNVNQETETTSAPLEAFPIGHVFEKVEIKGHDSHYIYAKISDERSGEIHISRIDGDNASVSTLYANGTQHSARVLGYSQINNAYILTLDPKIIKQKYLRPQDIPIGELVTVQVISVSAEAGMKVKVFDKFEAIVPPPHLSDVKLIYPERKFKIGSKVKGRILSVSKFKSEISITLKKSLVGNENILTNIENAKVGDKTAANIISFKPSGAIVSFFGNLKGFLPKSEISETFVRKPEDHLRLGQTVTVRILSVDAENNRITVSCKLSGDSTESQKNALNELIVGRTVVDVQIAEKTKESVIVELPESHLRGVIFAGHLSDGNYEQNRAILKKLEVGSTISALVLEKDTRSKVINFTAKPSLIEAAKADNFPTKFKDIKEFNGLIPGYVKSVTDRGVFVGFGAKLVGLVLAKHATENSVRDLTTVFHVNQSISAKVLRIDEENKRFLLTLKEIKSSNGSDLIDPVDAKLKSISDITQGKITKATITSVKETQLSVKLADNVQGRLDVSQIFDNFNDIKDPKHPLAEFSEGQTLDVKVIGFFDPRKHVFLSSIERLSKQIVVELSAKKTDLKSKGYKLPTLKDYTVGSKVTAYINNETNGFYFANLSASIKGTISFLNLTDNSDLLKDVQGNFPLGSALQAQVKYIDQSHGSVTLTARKDQIGSIEDVKVGAKLPTRVLRITDNYVIVEISETVTASAFITDALDDYKLKLNDVFTKNEIVAATVVDVDPSNKRINVSLRSLAPKDKLITKYSDLKRGDVVNGFISNVTDKGVFVALGRAVTAYVKVSDLSDSYIKDFKKFFKIHQPVVGRVTNAEDERHITLTLKETEVNGELNILKRFDELKVGDIFEGSVKRAADFGVFVKLDGTVNISGLAHHSQISDNPIQKLDALFGEGDRVKVKILSINPEKKQLSLGMKASYFQDSEDIEMEDAEESDDEEDNEEADEDQDSDEDELVEDAFNDLDNDKEDSDDEEDSDEESEDESSESTGLQTNGFDWTASILDQVQDVESSDEEDFTQIRTKKKKKSKQIVEDVTGDIRLRAPQSVSDFERLIIGNPNSSIVWMNYMSFQLQLTEVEKAREIGERALKTINYREEQEKLNIWIALLNLENTFGTDESLEDVFKRSTEYMDSLTMHQKLVGIYIISEKFSKADALFKVITKKFGKESPAVWVSYASYLLDREQNEKAHEILASALNSLPKRLHIEVVRKFAQLEFTKGDAEQGRSLFEGLIADAPKRIDLWNVYIDQEIKKEEKKKAEELFERVLGKKISRKQAKFFFAKWLSLEEKHEDVKGADYVKAKAQEYVQNQ